MCPANSKSYMNEYMYGNNWYMKSRSKKDDNASRKRARYHKEKQWAVKPFDWKEIDHKNWVKAGNGSSNLRVVSRETNRRLWAEKAIRTRKSRLAKGWKY